MTKQLTRSHDMQLYGVAAGLAEYFNINPNVVRAAFIGLTLLVAKEIALLYIAMAVIVPLATSTKEQMASAAAT